MTPATPHAATDTSTHRPGTFWRGAALLLAPVALLLWLWNAADQFVPSAAGASLRILATNLALAIVVGLVIWALGRFVIRRFAARFPVEHAAVLAGSIVALVTLSPRVSRVGWLLVVVLVLVASTVVGGTLWTLVRGGGWGRRPALRVAGLALAGVVILGGGVWLAVPTGAPPAPLADNGTAPAEVADLTRAGTHRVRTMTYGSGTDRLREQYRQVAFRTPTVDLSPVLNGWSGERADLWGFDARTIPLNGMVWHPEGDGPFPLVVMVHGNKSSVEFSEGGFAYLGEHLASRGVIAVSIDENFLNTGLLDTSGGIGGADLSRALVLLEHLRYWTDHAADGLGGLSGKVDLAHVTLLGHSRGGEAVSVAAHLNASRTPPDGVPSTWPHGLPVESVIALAPSDGQYQPGGSKVGLTGVNYLVLQGSDDVDVVSFGGSSQYARAAVGPGRRKALLYIGGADHSQFNSLWGRRDIGNGLPKLFIDTGALIEPEQQRAITAAYVGSFVALAAADPASADARDAAALLQDHRAGAPWLPRTRYLSQYSAGDQKALYTGQDDDDLSTGACQGCRVAVTGAKASEQRVRLRLGDGDNRVLMIEPGDVTVTTTLPGSAVAGPASGVSLAVALESGGAALPVEVTITDAAGGKATVSAPMPAPPPIESHALKASWLQAWGPTEPVLQTVRVPASLARGVDWKNVRTIAVHASPQARLLLDDISLQP